MTARHLRLTHAVLIAWLFGACTLGGCTSEPAEPAKPATSAQKRAPSQQAKAALQRAAQLSAQARAFSRTHTDDQVHQMTHARAHGHVANAFAMARGALGELPQSIGRVLIIGDSMSGPLGKGLRPFFEARGDQVSLRALGNDALVAWQRGGFMRLRNALNATRPDAVVVIMGTNDVLHPRPEELKEVLATIEEIIAPRPCYWIGPPKIWTDDTGVVRVLSENARHCAYLDSEPFTFNRRPDRWHPTAKGGAQWAAASWPWLESKLPRGALAEPSPPADDPAQEPSQDPPQARARRGPPAPPHP